MKTAAFSIQLPRLTGEHAYMVAFTLDQIVNAIWHEYGDDMADFQGRVFPDGPPEPDGPPGDDGPWDTDDIPI
jgi:hypothetical protein